jgi:hypothetical protein
MCILVRLLIALGEMFPRDAFGNVGHRNLLYSGRAPNSLGFRCHTAEQLCNLD